MALQEMARVFSAILAWDSKILDLTVMQVRDDSTREPTLFPVRERLFMASLVFAFLFPYTTWIQAAGCALLLLLFNTLILPWLGVAITQPPPGPVRNEAGGTSSPAIAARTELVLYPLSVLALIVLYRNHLHIAAAAWAILALGNSMAALTGRRCSGGSATPGDSRGRLAATLPWNRQKTWVGSVSFVLAGTAGAYVLTRWIAPGIPAGKTLLVCAAAALVGAGVESLPIGLDDNLTVPLVVGAFIFCAFLVERSALDSNLPYLGRRIVLAIAANLAFALLARALGAASRSGAVCGFVLGIAIYLGYGYKSFILLFAFVLFGSVVTRLGFRRKAARGVAEPRGGARGWREGLANLLAPAFLAILVITTHHEAAFLIALVAALAEASGDTVSSEIGQWISDRAYLITTLRQVPAGESGGISPAGTVAGFAASAFIVGLALALRLCGPYRFAGPCIALGAAWAGNLFDSLLGATIERRGLVTNGIVNFAGTSLAGGPALGLALHLGL